MPHDNVEPERNTLLFVVWYNLNCGYKPANISVVQIFKDLRAIVQPHGFPSQLGKNFHKNIHNQRVLSSQFSKVTWLSVYTISHVADSQHGLCSIHSQPLIKQSSWCLLPLLHPHCFTCCLFGHYDINCKTWMLQGNWNTKTMAPLRSMVLKYCCTLAWIYESLFVYELCLWSIPTVPPSLFLRCSLVDDVQLWF